MALDWTHEHCGPECTDAPDCPHFPTVTDRINMAHAAFLEYPGVTARMFFFDILLYARSQMSLGDLRELTNQVDQEWQAHQKVESR